MTSASAGIYIIEHMHEKATRPERYKDHSRQPVLARGKPVELGIIGHHLVLNGCGLGTTADCCLQ